MSKYYHHEQILSPRANIITKSKYYHQEQILSPISNIITTAMHIIMMIIQPCHPSLLSRIRSRSVCQVVSADKKTLHMYIFRSEQIIHIYYQIRSNFYRVAKNKSQVAVTIKALESGDIFASLNKLFVQAPIKYFCKPQ